MFKTRSVRVRRRFRWWLPMSVVLLVLVSAGPLWAQDDSTPPSPLLDVAAAVNDLDSFAYESSRARSRVEITRVTVGGDGLTLTENAEQLLVLSGYAVKANGQWQLAVEGAMAHTFESTLLGDVRTVSAAMVVGVRVVDGVVYARVDVTSFEGDSDSFEAPPQGWFVVRDPHAVEFDGAAVLDLARFMEFTPFNLISSDLTAAALSDYTITATPDRTRPDGTPVTAISLQLHRDTFADVGDLEPLLRFSPGESLNNTQLAALLHADINVQNTVTYEVRDDDLLLQATGEIGGAVHNLDVLPFFVGDDMPYETVIASGESLMLFDDTFSAFNQEQPSIVAPDVEDGRQLQYPGG